MRLGIFFIIWFSRFPRRWTQLYLPNRIDSRCLMACTGVSWENYYNLFCWIAI